ncbi:hypothetical protein FRB99_000255, partial [Tulasnella sp. 403]
ATYSGVPVYEMICKGVAVMRRRSDGWLNATQLLKVAGFDKPQRTRVLEREVQKGEHEKVQGGYGKYQGTWVPMDRGIALAKQYNINVIIQPIIEFVPAPNSPPLAPKHVTQPSHKPKRKGPSGDAGTMATRSAKRATTQTVGPPGPDLDDGEADAIGEDDEEMMVVEEASRATSPPASEDGSMTSSPSEASSSSQTPSPYASSLEGSGLVAAAVEPKDPSTWTGNPPAEQSASRKRKAAGQAETAPASHQISVFPATQTTSSTIVPQALTQPAVQSQAFSAPRIDLNNDPRRYGDMILEYFISDTTTIPSILISPPPDFDPNMAIDDDGHTALHWACAMGRVRVVKLLLTAGADIFKVNKGGQTPLMRSVMFSNNYDVRKFPELYELLHRSTLNIDNFNRTVFHHIVDLAMSKGKTHAARYYMETLLNRLSDFPQELADIINFQDEDGETALTLAARCRSKRLVKLLIDHGADPKIRNADQKTTEDYILEDERFRYSPVMRGQSLSFKMPFNASLTSAPQGAYGPKLHHSTAAQHATAKCTQDMAMLLDSLAASFDQELADKDRDLTQAHALLSNIQAEILESQRAVAALKTQAGALEAEQAQLVNLEGELKAKMGRRFRLGWEKWIKDEEAREKPWRANGGGATLPLDASPFDKFPAMGVSPERRTRATAGAALPEETQDLKELYASVAQNVQAGPAEIDAVCEQLRQEVEGFRRRRRDAFEEYVKLSAEAEASAIE